MNRDIPCFIAAHFQPPCCKMDEFNKKKKLLLLATSLSITAYIKQKKKKRSCWTRSWPFHKMAAENARQ